MVRIEDPTGAGRGKDTRVVGIAHKCEGVSTNTPKLIVDHILESRTVIRVDPRARQAPGRRECGVGSTKTDRWLYRAACYARPIIAAESETDIGSSFDYVWRQIESHVIHELPGPKASCIVGEVCVDICREVEYERIYGVRLRREETKSKLTPADNGFVHKLGRRRPSPIHCQVLRCPEGIHKVRGIRETRAAAVHRITVGVLFAIRPSDIKAVLVIDAKINFRDKIVLPFLLRRVEQKSRNIQSVAGRAVTVRLRHRVYVVHQNRIKRNACTRSNIIGIDTICSYGNATNRSNRVSARIDLTDAVCSAPDPSENPRTCYRGEDRPRL